MPLPLSRRLLSGTLLIRALLKAKGILLIIWDEHKKIPGKMGCVVTPPFADLLPLVLFMRDLWGSGYVP